MAEAHRLSRKAEERRKGWIGIVVWIVAALLLFGIIMLARNIGRIPGKRHYVYFEESVAGLLKNSKVKYRGVEAGRVVKIELTLYPWVLDAEGRPVRSEIPVSSPLVEVEMAIQNPAAVVNENSRAYLRTNPLSGMQLVDIQDLGTRSGAELARPPGGSHYETELFAGGVDLTTWMQTSINSFKSGAVTSIQFRRPAPGEPEPELVRALVQILVPFEFRNLDPQAHLVRARYVVDKSRAYIEIMPREQAPEDAYTLQRGPAPRTFLVEMPADAIGIDPLLAGHYAATDGGAAEQSAMVVHLEQAETEGVTGGMVKFLRVRLEGEVELPAGSRKGHLQRWVTLERRLTEGRRYFEVELLVEGNPLPENAPIEVARSPLSMLLERADTIAETIDYMPSIARNIEEASANVVKITTDLKDGAIGDVRQALSNLDANLSASLQELKESLILRVNELSTTLNTEVKGLGQKTREKLDEAMPPQTAKDLQEAIAGIRDSINDWKDGIAAARATFTQAQEVVGFKGEGKTIAETVNTLHAAVENLDRTMKDNEARLATTLDSLKDTLRTIEKVLEELRTK